MESTRKNINRARALTLIVQRRYEQLEKWGEQEHTWSDVAAVALQMLEYLLDDCNVRMPDGKEKKNGNK